VARGDALSRLETEPRVNGENTLAIISPALQHRRAASGERKRFTMNRNLEFVAKLYPRFAFVALYIARTYISVDREREREREREMGSYENSLIAQLVSLRLKFH